MALDYPSAPEFFAILHASLGFWYSDHVHLWVWWWPYFLPKWRYLAWQVFYECFWEMMGKVFRLELVEEDKDGGWLWCWGCFICNPQVPPDHMLTLSPQRHIVCVAKWSVLGNPYLQIGQSGNFTHRPIPRWDSRNDRLIGFRCVRVSEAAYLRLRSNFGTCLTARKTGVNDSG